MGVLLVVAHIRCCHPAPMRHDGKCDNGVLAAFTCGCQSMTCVMFTSPALGVDTIRIAEHCKRTARHLRPAPTACSTANAIPLTKEANRLAATCQPSWQPVGGVLHL
jgi:hypothetical protein